MRLLFLTERFPPDPGGRAASSRRLAGHLTALGHEVRVLALSAELPPGQATTQLADEDLIVHRLGIFADEARTLEQALTFLVRVCARGCPEAVWGQSPAGFLATWAARRFNAPCLLAWRGDDVDRLFYPPGDFARLTWMLGSAARVATDSNALTTRMRTVCDCEILPLSGSVDARTFSPSPRPRDLIVRYNLRPEECVLGFCGELRESKGLSFLLKAHREVTAVRPCQLLVIGDVAAEHREECLRTPGLVRTGFLPDARQIARHLRSSDVLLAPSLQAGTPNSLLEAMACGVPVIASTAGGIPEVIADGANGLLLPHTRLDLLGRKVREFLAWPEERRSALIAAARATVQERFTPERERAQVARLLAAPLTVPASIPRA